MKLIHWFHHLFNPHCAHCLAEREDSKVCQSCETLKLQLSIANHEKEQILQHLLSLTEKPAEELRPTINHELIKPKISTWNVRRQMLEAEDREAARILAQKRQEIANNSVKTDDIEKLEKELGLPVVDEVTNA